MMVDNRDDLCYVCFYRSTLNAAVDIETTEPAVSRSLTQTENMFGGQQAKETASTDKESASIHQELMDVDSHYCDSRLPIEGWTPKSLLEAASKPPVQYDVVSRSEGTQTGE